MTLAHRLRALLLIVLLLIGVGASAVDSGTVASDMADSALQLTTDNPGDADDRVADHTPSSSPTTVHPVLRHEPAAYEPAAIRFRVGDPPLRPPSDV